MTQNLSVRHFYILLSVIRRTKRNNPFRSEGKGIGMRKYLKLDELKALLNAPRRLRDRLILRLLYETGMRVGELAELRIGDIDLENSEITIQQAKRHKEGRKVPLVSEYTKMLIREYIGTRKNKRDYFLVSNKRTPLSRRQIERLVAKYGAQVGIDPEKCHPHVLRHTHAVYALKSGVDLRTLQQNLGHSSIEVTAIYLTLDIEDRKQVYEEHPLPELIGPDDPFEMHKAHRANLTYSFEMQ